MNSLHRQRMIGMLVGYIRRLSWHESRHRKGHVQHNNGRHCLFEYICLFNINYLGLSTCCLMRRYRVHCIIFDVTAKYVDSLSDTLSIEVPCEY